MFAGAVLGVGTTVTNDARAQTCNEVMDQAAATVLAQSDLSKLSTAARVDLLYALATVSPLQMATVITAPATRGLFRTHSMVRCEAALRTLSGKFLPQPGDQRALEEALARNGWDPSIAVESIRGNVELAQMAGYEADLIRIAQMAGTNNPLTPQMQETLKGVTGVSTALRSFVCPMFAQVPLGMGPGLLAQTVRDGIAKGMQQSSVITSMVASRRRSSP